MANIVTRVLNPHVFKTPHGVIYGKNWSQETNSLDSLQLGKSPLRQSQYHLHSSAKFELLKFRVHNLYN